MTSEIKDEIWYWLQDKLEFSTFPDNVVVVNFRIQKVNDGYELYQEGCDDFYEEHDTWMLSNVYEPHDNFSSLGVPSLSLSEFDVYELYKSQILNLIAQTEQFHSGYLKYITITYFNGQPELLKGY